MTEERKFRAAFVQLEFRQEQRLMWVDEERRPVVTGGLPVPQHVNDVLWFQVERFGKPRHLAAPECPCAYHDAVRRAEVAEAALRELQPRVDRLERQLRTVEASLD